MRSGSTWRASGLAFVTAMVTMVMQVLVHRMVSAKLMNNFAFLVISLTMLGFALSGVVLSRWLERLLSERDDVVATCVALFVLTTLAASAAFYHLDAGHQFVSYGRDFILQLGRWMPLALPYAVPFAFCGMILGLLLSDPRLSTGRVYFADLAGSALGAAAVLWAIARWGVERSALGVCAVFLVSALLLTTPRHTISRVLAVIAATAIVVCAAGEARVFDMQYPEQSVLWHFKRLQKPYGIEYVAWDPVARIEVSRIPTPHPSAQWTPSLIGGNPAFLERFRRMVTQNNWAFTYAVDFDGKPESLEGIEETVYAGPYQVGSVARPDVLVIGVGGGFDVLTALRFDASRITGVEINRATIDILTRVYRDYFRSWVEHPHVRLVAGEGRHFLASQSDRYDIIQLSGVDSYSGTPAAAHVFSENYLYTAEAFDLYLSRLSPNGLLSMMRVEFMVPRDMLRVLITAVAALRRAGVHSPADHIVVIAETTGRYVSLLVKKAPFTEGELQRLAAWVSSNKFLKLAAVPGHNQPGRNMYQRFLTLGDSRRERAFVAGYPFDVSPVDDNRPFFFHTSFWHHMASSDPIIASYSPPVMEYTLLMLLVVLGAAALVSVYLPLRFLAARGLRVHGAGRYAVFFACIGLGYLGIEIALLQKFGLFLGHPNYALSIILAALLLTSGVGSLFAGVLVRGVGRLRFMAYVLAALVLLEYFFVLPHLGPGGGLSFWMKILIVLLSVAPIGVSLGTFFPTALEQLKPTASAFAPWAWGINGIFSVLAPVVSVATSMTFGTNALLLAAIPVYLVAGFAIPSAPRTSTDRGVELPSV